MSIDWHLGAIKIGMTISVLVVGLVFGLLPMGSNRIPVHVRTRVLGVCNALAAGIFLAAGFVHLLSESISLFSSLYELHIVNPAFLLAPLGFFITFLIDKVLFLKNTSPHESMAAFPPKKGHQHRHVDHVGSESDYLEGDHTHSHHSYGGHGHSHGLDISEDGKPSVSNYVLVAVLSFHSILAGFVIGLDDSNSSAFLVFVALISHHWVESFALGVNLVRAQVHKKPLIMLVVFFALMAPLGIIGGTLINFALADSSGDVVEAYMVAIAAGSFLYVAIVDILVEEFMIVQDKWWKSVALFVGFTLESLVILLFESLAHGDEGHSH